MIHSHPRTIIRDFIQTVTTEMPTGIPRLAPHLLQAWIKAATAGDDPMTTRTVTTMRVRNNPSMNRHHRGTRLAAP